MAKKRGFIGLRAYNFVDKDPIIDFVRTAKEDESLSNVEIHEGGGPSIGTLHNWFGGKTRRPQFATVAAALLVCGVEEINLRTLLRKGKK
jgi:hypothetical protein